MKKFLLVLGLLMAVSASASETTLLCNDQNSHAVYRLHLNDGQDKSSLTTVIGDSSVLSAGSKELKRQEGESSDEWTTFAGRTNNGLQLVLLFNSKKAASLEQNQILEVMAYFQINRGDILDGNTILYCSPN